jgi:hypothetical protein
MRSELRLERHKPGIAPDGVIRCQDIYNLQEWHQPLPQLQTKNLSCPGRTTNGSAVPLAVPAEAVAVERVISRALAPIFTRRGYPSASLYPDELSRRINIFFK